MVILVNNIFLSQYPTGESIDQELESFISIADNQPGHQFIFLVNSNGKKSIRERKNLRVVEIREIKTLLILRFWYRFSLPRIINKYEAALVINLNCICSFRTTMPQILFLND